MPHRKKYKIIAAFLLIVFSLNTIAGFACSLGVDMGYNRGHHEHGKHHHSSNAAHKRIHSDDGSALSILEGSGSDDCCAGGVTEFAKLDKSIPVNNWILQAPVLLLADVAIFIFSSEPEPDLAVNSRFQFVRRSCFLNDTDIRIAIRSFQI